MDVLIEQLYCTIDSPRQWTHTLDRLSQLCGADGCVLAAAGHTGVRWMSSSSIGEHANCLSTEFACWLKNVLSHNRGQAEKVAPTFATNIQPSVAAPMFGWLASIAVHVATGETYYCLLIKPVGALPFSSVEIERMEQIRPHLERAIRLSALRGNHRNHFAVDVLQTVVLGSVVLRSDRSVVTANKQARALAPGLSFTKDNRLELADAKAQSQLVDALAHMTSASGPLRKYVIAIPGTAKSLPMIVTVLAAHPRRKQIFCDAIALLTIAPVAAGGAIGPQLLADLFTLTPAEARVANALANGESVNEIAQLHGVTTNTIRMQLKSVYGKTDTRRQTELVSLIAHHPLS